MYDRRHRGVGLGPSADRIWSCSPEQLGASDLSVGDACAWASADTWSVPQEEINIPGSDPGHSIETQLVALMRSSSVAVSSPRGFVALRSNRYARCSRRARHGRCGMVGLLWLPLCVLVLCILVQQTMPVQGMQPLLGASLSWAINQNFRKNISGGLDRNQRTVTFKLHSAFRMATTCDYSLFQNVSCALPHSPESTANSECGSFAGPDGIETGDASSGVCMEPQGSSRGAAKAVMAEHGVLCVGQVVRTRQGSLELIYSQSENSNEECASDASQAVRAFWNGSYSIVNITENSTGVLSRQLGKTNSFQVTALHTNQSGMDDSGSSAGHIDSRIHDMDVAVGVLVHTVHVHPEAVGLVAWLADGFGCDAGTDERGAGDILLPHCGVSDSDEPCSVNVNSCKNCEAGTACSAESAFSSAAYSRYWDGLDIQCVPGSAPVKTYVPLCCAGGHCHDKSQINLSSHPLPLDLSCEASQEQVDFNHHSPVPAFPLVVQAVSHPSESGQMPLQELRGKREAANMFHLASWRRSVDSNGLESAINGAGALGLSPQSTPHFAPYAPMYYQAFDPDGDNMTDLFPETLLTSGNVRCFFGSDEAAAPQVTLASDGDATGQGPRLWPSKLCLSAASLSQGAYACWVDEDCVDRSWGAEGADAFLGSGQVCAEPWSGCREYRDASSEGLSGNVIKFDFAFAALTDRVEARKILTQHLALTVDLPHDLRRTSHREFMDAWMNGNDDHGSATHFRETLSPPLTWPTSAASPALFSAVPCDPGTRNQPPVFVSGPRSTDVQVRSEYTCPAVGPCEIALHVRDFKVASGNGSGIPEESQDEITIEAAIGFRRLDRASIFRVDGSSCQGFGSLSCIFRLSRGDRSGGLEEGVGRWDENEGMLGSVVVKCFTALDLHQPSAAPRKKTCRSVPLCVKIRIEPVASYRGVLNRIFYPSSVTSTAPRVRLDVGEHSDQRPEIIVDWNPPHIANVSSFWRDGDDFERVVARQLCTAGPYEVSVNPYTVGPTCDAVFQGVPADARDMTVTIQIANTDFAEADEYVSGVYINGAQFGSYYLVHSGVDEECGTLSRILDAEAVPESVLGEAVSLGKVTVSITTSGDVNCCPCNGFILYAIITVTWRAQVNPSANPEPTGGWNEPSSWTQYVEGPSKVALQFSVGQLAAGPRYSTRPAPFQNFAAGDVSFNGASAILQPDVLVQVAHAHRTVDGHSSAQAAGNSGNGTSLSPVVFHFRLAMTVNGRQLHGPQSNPTVVLPAFHREVLAIPRDFQNTVVRLAWTDRSPMIVAEWHSDILRILRIPPTTSSADSSPVHSQDDLSKVNVIGHFHCRPIREGVVVLDSTEQRLLVLVEPLIHSFKPPQYELLVVNVDSTKSAAGAKQGKTRQGDRGGFTDASDSSEQIKRVIVKVQNTSLWNVELDERMQELLVVSARHGGYQRELANFSLIAIKIESGQARVLADLADIPPVFAVSAFSRVQRVYFCVDVLTQDIQRIALGSGTRDAVRLQPIKRAVSKAHTRILAMSCTDLQGLLYTLESAWPLVHENAVTLVVYDPRRAGLVSSQVTSLKARDFQFGASPRVMFNIREGHIGILTASGVSGGQGHTSRGNQRGGEHVLYFLATNVTTRKHVDWLAHRHLGRQDRDTHSHGRPVYFGVLQSRHPEISAISTPPIPAKVLNMTTLDHDFFASYVITVTGANFGVRDVGQWISIGVRGKGNVPCKQSVWLSDSAMTCRLPDFTATEGGLTGSTMIASAGIVDLTVHVPQLGNSDPNSVGLTAVTEAAPAIVATESWDRISPTAASSLVAHGSVTVHGRGFRAPYESYRCLFTSENHIVATGAPLRSSASTLVFELPLWPAAATRTAVSVRRLGTGSRYQTYASDTTVHFSGGPAHFAGPDEGATSVFEFQDAWERLSSTSAQALGGTVLTVTGAGLASADDSHLVGTEPSQYALPGTAVFDNVTKYACVFSVEGVGADGGGQKTDAHEEAPRIGATMLAVPAVLQNQRQLTCTLGAWRFPAQRVSFRLFRGCCPQQQAQRNREAAEAVAAQSMARMKSGSDVSAVVPEPLVSEAVDIPGDTRYTWREVQRTLHGQATNQTDMPFDMLEGWYSLAPIRAAVGDGTVVNVKGFGFNKGSAYRCAFSSATSNVSGYLEQHQAVATVLNDTQLSCTPAARVGKDTFPLALVSIFRQISYSNLQALVKLGPSTYFEFQPAFNKIVPQALNMVLSGIPLTITGAGFREPEARRYHCVIVSWTGSAAQYAAEAAAHESGVGVGGLSISLDELVGTGIQAAKQARSNITYISDQQLRTARIEWPHAAGKVLVVVVKRPSATTEVSGGALALAVFPFTFGEGVVETLVAASGYAQDAVMVTFSGVGFNVHSNYSCMLVDVAEVNSTSQHHGCLPQDVHNLSSYACMPQWGTSRFSVSVPAVANDASIVVCPALQWRYARGALVPVLMRAESVVPGSMVPMKLVEIKEHWTHVTSNDPRDSRLVSANGSRVTVMGYGFADTSSNATEYLCNFTQHLPPHGERVHTTTALSQSMHTQLACDLEAGTGRFVAGIPLRVDLLTRLTGTSDPWKLVEPFPAGTSARTLMVAEILLAVWPTRASATGGSVIHLFGHGFTKESYTTYHAHFGSYMSPEACKAVNSSVIVCLTPSWPREGCAAQNLTLSRNTMNQNRRLLIHQPDQIPVEGQTRFHFDTDFERASPSSVAAWSGGRVLVQGKGYCRDSPYVCQFSHGFCNNSEWVYVRVAAEYVNASLVTCDLTAHPFTVVADCCAFETFPYAWKPGFTAFLPDNVHTNTSAVCNDTSSWPDSSEPSASYWGFPAASVTLSLYTYHQGDAVLVPQDFVNQVEFQVENAACL